MKTYAFYNDTDDPRNENQSPWLIDVYNKYLADVDVGFLVEIGVGHTLYGMWRMECLEIGHRCDDLLLMSSMNGDMRCGSNTADLLDIGWKGIYIEPIKEYCDELQISHVENLDRLTIVNLGASDQKDTKALFLGESFVPNDQGNSRSGGKYEYVNRHVELDVTSKILSDNDCPKHIDVMSIDVEGLEDKVLRGIDFTEHIPKIIIVEINKISPEIVTDILPNEYAFLGHDNLNGVWINSELVDAP